MRPAILIALVALVLTAATAATAMDSRLIVVGKSIGDVRIGSSQTDVVTSYGRARSSSTFRDARGRTLVSARYRAHGADLVVVYHRGRAVWIETSSRYYRTSGGVGPGAPLSAAAALPGFRRDLCEGGYLRRLGDTLTTFAPRARVIARVRVVKVAYYDC